MEDLEKKYLGMIGFITFIVLFFTAIFLKYYTSDEKQQTYFTFGILACVHTLIILVISTAVFLKKDSLGEEEFKKYLIALGSINMALTIIFFIAIYKLLPTDVIVFIFWFGGNITISMFLLLLSGKKDIFRV